jgi:uncharacterized membrane protein YhfC
MYAHPRLVSTQKKCKTAAPIEICKKSKKRLQLPLFEKKIRERETESWMCMCLGERIRHTTFVISLSLTLYIAVRAQMRLSFCLSTCAHTEMCVYEFASPSEGTC